ncbi:N-acetyltransferase 8-like isoform X2 [Archocentrus centrarchus]|nr:N-acetyltransferase 8-like isoform X2 [Archocentrus centrarchus]
MPLVIRRYRPADKDTVLTLFTTGTWAHICPCFHNAMTSPLYLTITLALGVVGYLLGSVFGAVLFPAAWVGVIYCCCHEMYCGYVRERLRTDMQDIPGNFLSRSDDCFWVAEAEVEGRPQVIGMVAVAAKHSGTEKYGEMFRMIVAPQCRRMGLGFRLAQTAVDFCKERGFSKVVLETTSTQMAAVALYSKLGFTRVFSRTNKLAFLWISSLARVTIIKMEKYL